MKKISLIIAALLLSLAGHAQQALWGGSQIVSPEIHEDNTVTFRLLAPNAGTVQVTGDFLPTQEIETPFGKFDGPGAADLQKNDDGVWEYTSEALDPELYSYSFIVDGLKILDPSNIFMNRDVVTVTNIFIIGGGRADLYKVQDVPHGTVARVWYDSPTLGFSRRMTVYTPAGYEDSDKSYPVFYLLHGAGGDEEAWIALGRTAQILDNLIARGKAEPMIVVMTNGNGGQQAAPGESPTSVAGFNQPKMMEGSFELSFPEVIKYVDTHYRTIPEKHARAIAGLSMGGFHSMHISSYYPDTFDYVGLFSAAIMPQDGTVSPVYEDIEGKLAVQFEKKPALYYIAIGNADFLYQANVEYRQLLDSKGYPYEYFETDGGHIWRNWRIYLTEFAPKLFK
ncbi:MAG: esterase [Bacteroidales bacterium]|nr:esterase [Bacteroidales bacterium]